MYEVYIFDKTGFLAQFDQWVKSTKLPAQCYVMQVAPKGNAWYFNQRFGALANALPINLSDVPKEVKASCLIMGLSP